MMPPKKLIKSSNVVPPARTTLTASEKQGKKRQNESVFSKKSNKSDSLVEPQQQQREKQANGLKAASHESKPDDHDYRQSINKGNEPNEKVGEAEEVPVNTSDADAGSAFRRPTDDANEMEHAHEYPGESLLGEDDNYINSEHSTRSSRPGSIPYDFNPLTTEAVYYVGSTGDFINKGVISEPSISISSTNATSRVNSATDKLGEQITTINDNLIIQWEDEDENEEAYLTHKYSNIFENETERLLTFDECAEIREGLDFLTRASAAQKSHGGFHYASLDLSERGLTDLCSIEHFPSLKYINVSRNYLTDMRPLGGLPNLVKIDASRNQIELFLELHSEKPLPMREVNFSRNAITELVELKTYWALSIVNLSYNKLTTVDGFQECSYLRVLNLSHNEISTLGNMNCPSLIILLLKYNRLTNIDTLSGCVNLNYLNISNNMITELECLRKIPHLMELRIQENSFDLLEVEYLKSLIYLSHLWISPNSCMEVVMARSMLVFILPQIRYLDGITISTEETLQAQNTFNPSFSKLAFEDHTNLLLDKACQAGNIVFDEFCKTHPVPPILLLVGSSKSNTQELATFLKDKYKYRVMIGGVHSTATTIESGDQNVDIPISMETFKEMKNRGEFLATSHILGRLCGFASSQIARASERGAILVASVPLGTAISLRKWRLSPKMVLILPTNRPHFNVDDFLEAEALRERKKLNSSAANLEEVLPEHEHKIKFAKRALPEEHHEYIPQSGEELHSILKIQSSETLLNEADDERWSQKLLRMKSEESEEGNLSKKMTAAELFPPKTYPRYSTYMRLGEEVDQLEKEFNLQSDNYIEETKDSIFHRHPLHLMKKIPPFNVTNRLRRLSRLASVLLLQSGEISSSTDIPDIMMSLPSIRQQPTIEPTKVTEIDWKKTLVQNKLYNNLLSADEAYYMVLQQTSFNNETPEPKETLRKTLIPSKPTTTQPIVLPLVSAANSKISNEFQLIVVKVESNENINANSPETGILGTGTDSSVKIRSNVQFSEENLSRLATEVVLDVEAEERIRARKPTAFVPSTHLNEDSGSDVADPELSEIVQEVYSDVDSFDLSQNEIGNQGESAIGELIRDSSEDLLAEEEVPPEPHHDERHSSGELDSHYLQNRFKHRDAMEKAIIKTREDYHQFHLENPGFFSAVLDTNDLEQCDEELEKVIESMLDTIKHKPLVKQPRLMSSYAGRCDTVENSQACFHDEKVFLEHRLQQLSWCNHEWNTGYQHPLQHMKNKYPSDNGDGSSNIFFSRKSCPKKLFDTKLRRRYSEAKFNQLQRAAELRRKKIKDAKIAGIKKLKDSMAAAATGMSLKKKNNGNGISLEENGTQGEGAEEEEKGEVISSEDEEEPGENEYYGDEISFGFNHFNNKNKKRFTKEKGSMGGELGFGFLEDEDEDDEESFTIDE